MNSLLSRKTMLCLAAVAGLMTGCAGLRQDWTLPEFKMPARWGFAEPMKSTAATSITGKWWTRFGDPQLDQLIESALSRNNDLAAAAFRVRQARLRAGLEATNLTPSVTVGGSASTTRDIERGKRSDSYGLNLGIGYEIDLWGKLAAARDAAAWEAAATEYDRQAVALSLVGTTASLYWQLAFLNQRMLATTETAAYLERVLALVRVRFEAGVAGRLDLLQAEQSLVNRRVELSQLEQQRAETRHALAIIFDESPQFRVSELPHLPDAPLPAIDAGLPAELLGRRPDLRAAELRLRESVANIDQTRASFYPTFSLTGSLGGSSTTLADVLQNPMATLGVGLSLPFIQWNTRNLSIQVSETRYEEAVVGFRQPLLRALSEVEDTLSARRQLEIQADHYIQLRQLSLHAEGIARVRYESGKTGVQQWLDEQERQRNAVTALAQNRLNRLNNLVHLYQALGGDALAGKPES